MANEYIPLYTALNVDPLTPNEIDAHPDADRIWATIAKAQDWAEEDNEEDLFKKDKELSELEEDKEVAEQRFTDMGHALSSQAWEIVYDDDDLPIGIQHNVIPDDDEEKAFLEVIEDRLAVLVEDFLDNHFREEEAA